MCSSQHFSADKLCFGTEVVGKMEHKWVRCATKCHSVSTSQLLLCLLLLIEPHRLPVLLDSGTRNNSRILSSRERC